jgi:hypothetical protein
MDVADSLPATALESVLHNIALPFPFLSKDATRRLALRQCQRDEEICDHEQTAENLEAEEDVSIRGSWHHRHVVTCDSCLEGRCAAETHKPVGSGEKRDQPEQHATDNGDDFHGAFFNSGREGLSGTITHRALG